MADAYICTRCDEHKECPAAFEGWFDQDWLEGTAKGGEFIEYADQEKIHICPECIDRLAHWLKERNGDEIRIRIDLSDDED